MREISRALAMLIAAAVFLSGCAAQNAGTQASPPGLLRITITDFGAVGDGTTLNTEAIQKTIDYIADSGGGTIVVPKGIFLSGALFLKPGVGLDLEKDGVIKGSTDVADYPKRMTRIEGHFQIWLPALINAEKVDHLRITGEGTLNGSGKPFWDEFRRRIAANRQTTNLDVERPRLVFISDSQDVQVSGIHFKDSGFWNLHIYKCNDVLIEGLDINSGPTSPSTDGMDIDSSQNVTIHKCTIAVNDDCIALKGSKGPLAMDDKDSPPVEHIRISDCTYVRGPCCLTCGSEATIVRDVVVENCTVASTARGLTLLRLKLRPDTPQNYQDIHIRNIKMEAGASLIGVAPWRQYFDLQGHAPPTSSVHNISISGITGTCTSLGSIVGNPGDTIDQVTFEDIDVKLASASTRASTRGRANFVNVGNLILKDVKVNGQPFLGQ